MAQSAVDGVVAGAHVAAMVQDVPSPIDLTNMDDASEWALQAGKRPGRAEMLQRFVTELAVAGATDVLELGSGPGFLAEKILTALPSVHYTALDFSAAMHELAQARLGARAETVQWIQRDFKALDWASGLGQFSAIVTNQALHEVRHKSRVSAVHAAVRTLLRDDGVYLFCDHWHGDGGLPNGELHMTVDEHRAALAEAGFADVAPLAMAGSLVFFRLKRAAL